MFDDGGGPALCAGGEFTTAGGTAVNQIAQWDGSSWAPLGSGVGGPDPSVLALTVFDDGGGSALYAGGYFTSAGGVAANHVAKWDGSSWAALGSGLGGAAGSTVNVLTVFDDGGGPALYAGGSFTTAGGVAANHIAKWDGSSWAALGSGTTAASCSRRYSTTAAVPALYAGGSFTTAGGAPANRIAKWDGSSWAALGSGTNDRRPGSGGVRRRRRAGALRRWRLHDRGRRGGESHREVGRLELGGARRRDEQPVRALTVFDDGGGPALYAGGFFTTAGGVAANYASPSGTVRVGRRSAAG